MKRRATKWKELTSYIFNTGLVFGMHKELLKSNSKNMSKSDEKRQTFFTEGPTKMGNSTWKVL